MKKPQFAILLSALHLSANALAGSRLEAVRLVDLVQKTAWTGKSETSPTTTQIRFAVSSSGCTSEKDFTLSVDAADDGQAIRVIRTTGDRCKGIPRETVVAFELENVKPGVFFPIVIANPVLPNGASYDPGTLLPLE